MFSGISLPQVSLLTGSFFTSKNLSGKNTAASTRPSSLSEAHLLALISEPDLARHLTALAGKFPAATEQGAAQSLSFHDLPPGETARLVPAFCQPNVAATPDPPLNMPLNMPINMSGNMPANLLKSGVGPLSRQMENRLPQVYVCGECSSTFDVAWQLVSEGRFNAWDSVVCAQQAEGRGQLRRHWHSPAGNLYVTFRLPQTLRGSAASLIVAYLLLQGLLDVLGASAKLAGAQSFPSNWQASLKIKWPNDILLHEQYKVGGILLEERGDVLLAGFGLNLQQRPPLQSQLRQVESNEEDVFMLPAANLADFFTIFSANYSKKNQISPLGLWLLLVGRQAFWYDTKVKPASEVEQLAMLTPCLAWLGRGIQVYAPCFKNEVASSQAEHSFALCTGVLSGLGPCGELCLTENSRQHLLTSGSLRLL